MPDKSGSDGQPSLEKLEREGVSPRRCISYEGLGEYSGRGNGGSAKPTGNGGSKAKSPPMRKSTGGGY